MPTITVNGVQLFHEVSGSSGEPFVLVHGSWVDSHSWDAVVPDLSRSFRVLTYDRRGHSQSERPASSGSIREDVTDLVALIEGLQLAPAHIAGTSLGGSIVLRLAGERPDLFLSMIVHEPPLFSLLADMQNGQGMLQAINARIAVVVELLEANNMEGGAREFVETIAFGPGAWAQLPSEVKKTAIFNAPTFLDEMHDPEAHSIDLARLRNFSKPALLTLGEHGPPFFPPIIEKLAKVLPQAERKTFLGAGHEPEQSDPETYVRTLAEFIAKTNRVLHN
ncbi:MAG: alpha/beta hydrolase [Chloroflexi bacterium]|nr:MAG: alpha/beta hydrolase [Chloroflexota bacterium]